MSDPQIAEATLLPVAMGIDTHEEPVVYMRSDCDVCLSEGFSANTRLQITAGQKQIVATLNIVRNGLLDHGQIGLSHSAWGYLSPSSGEPVRVGHAPVVASLRWVRKKVYGNELDGAELNAIVEDISQRRYSDIEIASFLTACAGDRMSQSEVVELTRAMVKVGNRLHWPESEQVFDKHCVGGLPGNRTTPIVIAIASAAGLLMPKTSSRAITSPAGTADAMEVLTEVDLDLDRLQTVVRTTGACLAWGGRVKLSPTDDLLIRIERALDLDGEGQLVASVLSKKIAAGSTHVLIDIPVGPTAKVRSQAEAQRLSDLFQTVASALDIIVRCVITDGRQTVGYGIGPAEEAKDVLAVLKSEAGAPADLRERSVFLAANLLSMVSEEPVDHCLEQARDILESGRAWAQFERICQAQGGLKIIPRAAHQVDLKAPHSGTLEDVDNRRLAQLAKLAGAPESPVSGLRLQVKLGDLLEQDQVLATLFAATAGELAYSLSYYRNNVDLFSIRST